MTAKSHSFGRGMRITRTAQIGFVCVLLVCVLQTVWWVYDQARYTADVRDRIGKLYDGDIAAARDLHQRGATLAEVRSAFPHLDIIEPALFDLVEHGCHRVRSRTGRVERAGDAGLGGRPHAARAVQLDRA